jgi:hypothetical protein
MNMKKAMIVLLALVAGLGGTAFGAAQIEEAQRNAEPARPGWEFEGEDLVEVTGKVSYENLIHPELRDGSAVYYLMLPRIYLYSEKLEEGKTVTVEGYLIEEFPGRGMWVDEEKSDGPFIAVTSAVIDGEEYEIEHPMYGPRYGNKRGAAPRMGGPMMGGPGMRAPRMGGPGMPGPGYGDPRGRDARGAGPRDDWDGYNQGRRW